MIADQAGTCRPILASAAGGRGVLVAALFALAASYSGGLQAAPVQQQAQDTIAIAPIEVTVLRTPFNNDDAPFAVSVLTEQDLQRARSGVYIEEVLQRMPGVQVQNRFNPAVGERIMIRGFGARAQFGLRGFRVIVDGIPATLPDGQASLDHLDIGTLGRVEVLRGPSSALFGNAGGGVISFTTRAPEAGPFGVEVAAVGGSDALMRGQVTASGTVQGTEYLFSAYRSSADGFRVVPDTSAFADDGTCTAGPRRCKDAYGAFERVGMNAKITGAVAGGALSLTANVLDLAAENPGSRRLQDSIPSFYTIANTYLNFRTRKDITQQQIGVRWVGGLGGFEGDLAVYGAHRTVYNPIPNDLVDLSRDGGGVRAALSREYALGIGDFDWHAGVDLDIQRDDRQEYVNAAGNPTTALLDQQENVRGMGFFFQGNLELPSGIDALAGLRYDSHRFEAEDNLISATNPDNSGSRTMTAFSPSVGLNVPLPGGFDIFGSASTLFETPTTTELANQEDASGGFNPDLDPMEGKSFEVGVRGEVGSIASFEVTGYQTSLENELIPYEVAGSPGVTFYRNAGESKHQGLEATLAAADPSGLIRADITGTWTDARFDEYILADGTDLGDCPAGDPEDTDGCRVPGVSPRRIQALLRLTPFGQAYIEGVATLSDDVPVNDRNTAAAPDFKTIDLRVGLDQVAVGGFTLSPWVAITNVTDEEYISSVAVNAFGTRFYEPGAPQSFQVGVRASFGGGD